jgi:hypothetical protein
MVVLVFEMERSMVTVMVMARLRVSETGSLEVERSAQL